MQTRWAVMVGGSVPALLVGCSEWPRFANVDQPPLLPPVSSVSFIEVDTETEEYPPSPTALTEEQTLGAAYEGLAWFGEVGWNYATISEQPETFGCDLRYWDGMPLQYLGDVDFFRFRHQGGSLCITVAPLADGIGSEKGADGASCEPPDPASGAPDIPQWEMPLFRFDPETSCPTGPWLNQTTPNIIEVDGRTVTTELPETFGLTRRGLFFPALPADDYVVFVSPVCGRYDDLATGDCVTFDGQAGVFGCVPYWFGAAVVPTEEACEQFNRDLFAEGPR